MKNTFQLLFMGGALAVGALLAVPGCGDDSDEGSGGASSTSSTSTTMTTTTGTMGSACDQYCNDIMTNCTGDNAQYSSMEACLGSCAGFPEGTSGATDGDSVACRTYHAGAAADDPVTHCGHAGPSGAATCGTTCEGYCSIVLQACTGENQVYADEEECMTACAGITDDVTYTTAATAGDSLACRTYHATVAASGSDMAATHCAHVAAVAEDPNDFPCSAQ